MEDPFTHLAGLSCARRRAENVRVIWEDDSLMVLVPRMATSPWLPLAPGSHLLVTPKRSMNFPVDASNDLLAHVNRVAAATCDALLVAGGSQPAVGGNNCEMFVSPPSRLGVAQLHVHVVVSRSAPVDDAFFHRTAAHMRDVLGGKGCL